jgi:hypothetical protein
MQDSPEGLYVSDSFFLGEIKTETGTEKPRYNESEGLNLYSRDFVIAGYLYHEINYRGTLSSLVQEFCHRRGRYTEVSVYCEVST